MGKNKTRKGQKHQNKHKACNSDERKLQGVDEKQFMLNDIVTISNGNTGIAIGVQYIIRVACDLNGFAWTVVNSGTGSVINAGTSRFGERNGQFKDWAAIYTEYQVRDVKLSLTLPQGGGLYSFSPVIHAIDPNGRSVTTQPSLSPAQITPSASNLKSVRISDPYKKHQLKYDYANWLLGTQTRAWRKTIIEGTSDDRELYSAGTDSVASTAQQPFVSPGQTMVYTVTSNQSLAFAGFGIFETQVRYKFAQRRAPPSQFNTQLVSYAGGFFKIPEGMKLAPIEEDETEVKVRAEEQDLSESQVVRVLKAIGLDRKKDLTGDGDVESNPGPVGTTSEDSDEPL